MAIEVIGGTRTPRLKKIDENKYYFVFQGKQTSRTFYAASAFSDGFAAVKKHSWSDWQFLDMQNNLSKDSYAEVVKTYTNGYAIVRKNSHGPVQFRDKEGKLLEHAFSEAWQMTKDGIALVKCDNEYYYYDGKNLSDDYYAAATESNEGYSIVRLEDYLYHYRNSKTGEVEEEGFSDARRVQSGFAAVRGQGGGRGHKWQYRRMSDGALSQEFSHVYTFSDDEEFAFAQIEDIESFCFVDRDLNTSEVFANAQPYDKGFAMVVKDGKQGVRDMLGRVTETNTKSGEDFYKYYNGQLSLGKMSALHFVDEKFCAAILKHEKRKFQELGKAIYSSDLPLNQKKSKYETLLAELALVEETIDDKRKKGNEMIEARKADDAKRRALERKKREAEKADKAAFDEFLGKL
ncbi:MAG: hypothetical protein J6A28_04680 [Clostridia bacterium]|nr:hypothetical protein [Clostridia bacterium]